jgi:hypothetical protein
MASASLYNVGHGGGKQRQKAARGIDLIKIIILSFRFGSFLPSLIISFF